MESLLAELEVQCDPVEEEVAEEVVEIEDLGGNGGGNRRL